MIPYRTRRRLKNLGLTLLTLFSLSVAVWFCSVQYLEPYVVYTREGAHLDFSIDPDNVAGEVARPPVGSANVSIYYNEGDDALNANTAMTKMTGYYIDSETLNRDVSAVWDMIKILPQGTPVMIELKAGYGSFYYHSTLTDAISAQSVSVDSVDELIKEMNKKGFYTIADVSSLRDYCFGLNHVSSGIPITGKLYLWMDPGGCYWLKPDDTAVQNWIISYVKELKEMGFNEVLLSDFMYPVSDAVTVPEDKDTILATTAKLLLDELSEEGFTLSFGVADSTFPLPDGRTRIYLKNVDAQSVGAQLSQTQIPDPSVKLVFVAKTNDTRFEQASVLRPITSAEVLEAQKADKEKKNEKTTPGVKDEIDHSEEAGPETAPPMTEPPVVTPVRPDQSNELTN